MMIDTRIRTARIDNPIITTGNKTLDKVGQIDHPLITNESKTLDIRSARQDT